MCFCCYYRSIQQFNVRIKFFPLPQITSLNRGSYNKKKTYISSHIPDGTIRVKIISLFWYIKVNGLTFHRRVDKSSCKTTDGEIFKKEFGVSTLLRSTPSALEQELVQ